LIAAHGQFDCHVKGHATRSPGIVALRLEDQRTTVTLSMPTAAAEAPEIRTMLVPVVSETPSVFVATALADPLAKTIGSGGQARW